MGAGPSARSQQNTASPPAREPVPTGPFSRPEARGRGGRSTAASVVSDDMVARRVKRPHHGHLDFPHTPETRSDIAPRHARHLETSFEDRSVAQESQAMTRNQPVIPERSHDTAWLDDCITMELEASQEMVRSTRSRLEAERAAKEEALAKFEDQKQVSASLEAENHDLQENYSKLQAEMEALKQEMIERTRQHDEESVRLRTELRMARRHEEFLSKELEAQRAAAGRRLKDVQARSEQELETLRSAVHELNDKCERMAMGTSLKMIAKAGRSANGDESDPDHRLNLSRKS